MKKRKKKMPIWFAVMVECTLAQILESKMN